MKSRLVEHAEDRERGESGVTALVLVKIAFWRQSYWPDDRETPRILREATAATLPTALAVSLKAFLRVQRGRSADKD